MMLMERHPIRRVTLISGVALAVLLQLACLARQVSGQQNSCHLRELDLCATSLLVLVQAPGGLATSDTEIQKQCTHLRDSSQCFNSYTRRCMTPMQRELVAMASNSTMGLMEDYCTKGSKFRQNYLKHAPCLSQYHKKQEHKSCTRDLQAALELLGGQSAIEAPGKRLQLACCSYRRFEGCLSTQIERKCGKETLHFVGSTFRRASSRAPDAFCRHLKPDGQECRALLPKPGALPKGSKSGSIVSRLLSAYTGA